MNKNIDRFNPMMDIRFSIIIPPVMNALRDCTEQIPGETEQCRCPPEQKIRESGLMMPCDCLTADQL
jgi:hypothetical protein